MSLPKFSSTKYNWRTTSERQKRSWSNTHATQPRHHHRRRPRHQAQSSTKTQEPPPSSSSKTTERRSKPAPTTAITRVQHENFRRPFLGDNPSLHNHLAACQLGLSGNFTYEGDAGLVLGKLTPHGTGRQLGRFGAVLYEGSFHRGHRHGQGLSYRSNGSVEFSGVWALDCYEQGEYFDNTNRLEYTGTFDASNRPHGNGVFHYSDRTRYVGEFRNGLFHGHGKRVTDTDELIVAGTFALGRLGKWRVGWGEGCILAVADLVFVSLLPVRCWWVGVVLLGAASAWHDGTERCFVPDDAARRRGERYQ